MSYSNAELKSETRWNDGSSKWQFMNEQRLNQEMWQAEMEQRLLKKEEVG